MARADGKLYELLADEVCRTILRFLLRSREPTTQRALTAALPFNSSTVSRRMSELEDAGLVVRAGGHAPYSVLFPGEVRDLLLAGSDLARVTHEGLARAVASEADELREGSS